MRSRNLNFLGTVIGAHGNDRSTNQSFGQTRPKRAHTARRLRLVALDQLQSFPSFHSFTGFPFHSQTLSPLFDFSLFSHSARRDAMRSLSTPTRRSFTGHHTLMPAAQADTADLFVPTRAFISWTFSR